AQAALLVQVVLVVEVGDVGEVDPGQHEGASPVQRGERHRDQLPRRSEQDRRVQRLRRGFVGGARRGGAQFEREPSGGFAPGQYVDRGASVDRELGGQVGG